MKKTDLLRPGGSRGLQLGRLAKQINERQDVIDGSMDHLRDKSASAICEVILQGQALMEAKEMVGHGNFYRWLESHCPLVSTWMAAACMRVASNQRRVTDLGATSLRQALEICAGNPNENGIKTNGHTKSWPPFVEVQNKCAKFVGYVERYPVASLPPECKEKLKADLMPVASELWPDKFA